MPSVVYVPVREEDLVEVQEYLGELVRRKREAEEVRNEEKDDVWEYMLDLPVFYQNFTPGLQQIFDVLAEHAGDWVRGEDVAAEMGVKPPVVYGYLSGLTKELVRFYAVDQWPFDVGRGPDGKIRYRMSPKRAEEVRQGQRGEGV